jgi:hypothetical protein
MAGCRSRRLGPAPARGASRGGERAMLKKIVSWCLVLALAGAVAAQAQDTKTFTGKITEVARATQLDLGKTDTFYVLRLEEYPNLEFRLPSGEAVRSGVIAAGGVTGILTPKQSKGLGWKVRLTCDANKTGPLKTPAYKVHSLEKLGD